MDYGKVAFATWDMTVKRRVLSILMVFAFLVTAHAAPAAPAHVKRYAFAITNDGQGDAEYARLLANPAIDGIAVGASWDRIEPREGVFDWSGIDAPIAAAKKLGKKVTLHIVGSLYGRPPAWLASSGARFVSVSDPRFPDRPLSVPIPWDDVTLSKWTVLVQALAKHISDSRDGDTLFAVSLTMPMPEMTIIYCRGGAIGDQPYDRAKYLAAWERMVDVYESAFPSARKLICAPHMGFIGLGMQDVPFYQDVMDYALNKGGRTFGVFATDLSAAGSDRTSNYLSLSKRTWIGYQTISSSTGDAGNRMKGSLQAAVEYGVGAGADYFEIYAVDVKSQDPAIQAAIASIHR